MLAGGQVAELTPDALRNLPATHLAMLTKEAIAALTGAQLAAVSAATVAAMPPQARAAFEAARAVKLAGAADLSQWGTTEMQLLSFSQVRTPMPAPSTTSTLTAST